MTREDRILCTIIVTVMLLSAVSGVITMAILILAGGARQSENVERVIPETTIEEPENTLQKPVTQEEEQDAKNETEPKEVQELSLEEIWQQEADYLCGYIYGDTIYNNYSTIKGNHELNLNDIPESSYQEYIKATEQLLNESMESSEISDETIERYNAAIADFPDKEYLRFDRESIMSMQGFQEGVIYRSYMEAAKELLYRSGEMTEEQYQAWFEETLYQEEDITHETVMKRIEYSQKLLAEYGKENIPIPYFN